MASDSVELRISNIKEELEDSESDIRSAKRHLMSLKKSILETETKLVEAQIRHDRLIEQLVIVKQSIFGESLSERDKEIAAFKIRMPELLKKIK